MTVGGCVPSRVLLPNQWGDLLAAFPYPRVEDCLCPGEGPTAAPIRNPFIHTSAANYAESTDMPRSHLLSRKYLPFARRLVNCCVQSWLWTPCAPHSDEGQVQVAVPMPSGPEVPCYGIFAWRILVSLDNLPFSFCFVSAEVSLVWGKKTDTGSGELVASVLISSVPGGTGGTGKTVFNRLRVFLIELWKRIGFCPTLEA